MNVAVPLPAFLGAPTQAEFRALKALCVYWGLAYQIADDLADAARAQLSRLLGQADRTLRRLTAAHPRWAYLAEFQAHLLPVSRAHRTGLAA